jgi:hypothetical protein
MGHHHVFLLLAVFAVIGLVASLIFSKFTGKLNPDSKSNYED